MNNGIVNFEGWDLDATGDEPRVRDIDVATRAGLAKPADVRRVIDANWDELTAYGEIRIIAPSAPIRRGPKGREYWLNEEQATALVTMLKTKTARALRVVLVKLFVAYRRGQVQAHTLAAAPIQARISDDPMAVKSIRVLCQIASRQSGLSIQRIQGMLRKPWGVMSIYRIALSHADHTVARLREIIESPPVRRLSGDRRQLDMWKSN
jgi:hypothetical protein